MARHGQTDWNKKERFKGRVNVPLNATGIQQATALATHLAGVKGIGAVYSSPLPRAVQTAEKVSALYHLDFRITEELNDFDYGEWQGLTFVEVQQKYPDLCRQWAKTPDLARIPSAETLDEVRRRTLNLVTRIAESGTSAVLISHRMVFKVLICALLGLSNAHIWNFRMDVCAVTTLVYEEGRYILVSHNDTCFLGAGHSAPPSDL